VAAASSKSRCPSTDLRVRPLDALHDPAAVFVFWVGRRSVDEKLVGITHDGRAIHLAHPRDGLARLRAAKDNVPETDNFVNPHTFEFEQNCVQGDKIA